MKKFIFLGTFWALIFIQIKASDFSFSYDDLRKEHGKLIARVDSFLAVARGQIKESVEKTNRLVKSTKGNETSLKTLIKKYESDKALCEEIEKKAKGFIALLKESDAKIKQKSTEFDKQKEKKKVSQKEKNKIANDLDDLLMMNEKRLDKLNELIDYAKDIAVGASRQIKVLNRELANVTKNGNK